MDKVFLPQSWVGHSKAPASKAHHTGAGSIRRGPWLADGTAFALLLGASLSSPIHGLEVEVLSGHVGS